MAAWPGASAKTTFPTVANLLRRDLRPRPGRLHARGAVFELRNFPEWIERRVGQEIGRGLCVRERDEHNAVGDRIVLAGGELDGATAGGDAHHLARCDAEAGQLIA
jgi:hypothetical protein